MDNSNGYPNTPGRVRDENFSIAYIARSALLDDGVNGPLHLIVGEDYFDPHFFYQVDLTGGFGVAFRVPFLPAAPHYIDNGQHFDPDIEQGLFNIGKFSRSNYSGQRFHAFSRVLKIKRFNS
jgi:hypothetical protein